jgi:predicted nucleotidyltransferase
VKRENLSHIISALKEYNPERIILFGSQARGDEDEYSDLDIVIIKETGERFLDRLKTVYELVQPTFAMDVLVYTRKEC